MADSAGIILSIIDFESIVAYAGIIEHFWSTIEHFWSIIKHFLEKIHDLIHGNITRHDLIKLFLHSLPMLIVAVHFNSGKKKLSPHLP